MGQARPQICLQKETNEPGIAEKSPNMDKNMFSTWWAFLSKTVQRAPACPESALSFLLLQGTQHMWKLKRHGRQLVFSFRTKDVIALWGKQKSCACDHPPASATMQPRFDHVDGFAQATKTHELPRRLKIYLLRYTPPPPHTHLSAKYSKETHTHISLGLWNFHLARNSLTAVNLW